MKLEDVGMHWCYWLIFVIFHGEMENIHLQAFCYNLFSHGVVLGFSIIMTLGIMLIMHM